MHRSKGTQFVFVAKRRCTTQCRFGLYGTVPLLALLAVFVSTSISGNAFGQSPPSTPKGATNKSTAKPGTKPKPGDDSAKEDMPAEDSKDEKAAAKNDDGQNLPPEMTIEKPLLKYEEWRISSRGAEHRKFTDRLLNGDMDPASQRIIKEGIRQEILALSLPEEREQLAEHVARLLRSIQKAADRKAVNEQRQFRESLAREIVVRCRELKDNQYYVRLNATNLLGNLFLFDSNPGAKTVGEFYTGQNRTYDNVNALLEILELPGQPEPIKIAAVDGLKNAAIYGNPALEPTQNIRVATSLIAELNKPKASEWYQERLCAALACIDQVRDLNSQPFIIQVLAKVLFDRDRTFFVRSAAAKAIGRTKLEPSIDLNVLVYGIADLSRQVIVARNEKKPVRRWCIANIWLAFKPKDNLEKAQRAGLLDRVDEPAYQKYKKAVNEVYNLIRPLVVQELVDANSQFSEESLESIVKWLKANAPSQLRVAPNLPPIVAQPAIDAESASRAKPLQGAID